MTQTLTDRGTSVAAIVVTHQSERFLPACLDSLAEQAGTLDLTVVVADSASTDGSADICKERGIAFLPGPNEGFGAAVNRALSHDGVRDARYLLVMNPDVEVAEGSLAEFVALCDQRPDCAVFAPRQVDQHGRLVCSMGREPSPESSWLAWRTGWPVWIWEQADYEHECRCDWVMGAFMLIRPQVFESLGGFDERFFLYFEEVDLCTRARRAGWQVAYIPQLTIRHWWVDRQFDAHRERIVMWSELVYMRKWFGVRARASMRIALLARMSRQLVRRLRSGEATRPPRVRLWAALRFRPGRYGPERS